MAALRAAGISFTRDEEAFEAGVLVLRLGYPFDGRTVSLTAAFPDLYPYFRPEVVAEDLNLTRHQNPIGKHLCLIGRRTSNWLVRQTLAELLHQQLPDILKFDQTGDVDALVAVEEPIGEPASDHYNSESVPRSYVLFDSAWRIDPDARQGEFEARGRELAGGSTPIIQAVVTKVTAGGRELAAWNGPVPPELDRTFIGRWIRRDAAILGGISAVVQDLGDDEKTHLFRRGHLDRRPHTRLSAILFPEEVTHRKYADGWCVLQENIGPTPKRNGRGDSRLYRYNFVRAARAGPGDLAARMPAIASLGRKSVLIVGLGAIGAPTAISLARAGVGALTLLDHDIMEPATARRWPIGWTGFGHQKVEAIRARLEMDYPWTTVRVEPWRLGAVENPLLEREPQRLRLEAALENCDLVIDATAEVGVNQFLSDLLRLRGVPYIMANATPGIWGGMVAQFLPQGPTCWMCLRHALYGSHPTLSLPPADPAGEVQPPGCAEATFTGSAFDVEEVSLEAVRMAAGVLRAEDGYPETDWDLSILRLRDDTGHRQPPRWEGMKIASRPDCTCQNPA